MLIYDVNKPVEHEPLATCSPSNVFQSPFLALVIMRDVGFRVFGLFFSPSSSSSPDPKCGTFLSNAKINEGEKDRGAEDVTTATSPTEEQYVLILISFFFQKDPNDIEFLCLLFPLM